MEALYLISILCLQFLFCSIYLTVDVTTNQVLVLFNCPFMACTVSVVKFRNALVWMGNICSWTLITVAIFKFCLSSTQMCISDCVWNAAIEACACMTRWATTVAAYLYATWITLIFRSIVSLSWWIEDASNCGIWSLRSDTLLLCLF